MGFYQVVTYGVSDALLFIFTFILTKKRYGWKRSAAAMMGLYLFAMFLICLRAWLNAKGILERGTILIETAASICIMYSIAEYRDCRTLFSILVAGAYGMSGHVVAKIFYTLGASPSVGVAAAAGGQMILLLFLMRYMLPSYRRLQEVYRDEWRYFCLLLVPFYVSMYLLFACLKYPGVTTFHNVVALFYLLTVYLLLVMAFRLFDRLLKEEQEERDQKILSAGMDALKREVGEIRRAEERIAAYNHDSRHFIRMIRAMMAEHDYDGVMQALEQMQGMPALPNTRRYCDNLAVNGMLSYYARMARERHIAISIQVDLPEKLGGHDWELAVVLGNVIENAVLACVEVEPWTERSIYLKGRRAGEQALFEVRNNFSGTVVFDRDTGLPVSGKGEGHGLGMRSVAEFVKQWNGTLDCGVENGWYFLRLLV